MPHRSVRLLALCVAASWIVVVPGQSLPPQAAAAEAVTSASVSAGGSHTCAIEPGGRARCWGWNDPGQLGTGTGGPGLLIPQPVDVVGLTSGARSVDAGYQHTCAITAAGGALCWGRNAAGMLGDGTTVHRTAPVPVSGLASGVTRIAAADGHTCAVVNGAAWCWGWNYYGQLGDATTTDRTIPVAVSALSSGVIDIDTGGHHTCAVVNGGAKCWGRNDVGQLGDGTTTEQHVAVSVTGLSTGVQHVVTGNLHSCALTSAGGVKCWGHNYWGQLGDGTNADSTTAVDVAGLTTGVVAITAGGTHTCAVTASGMKCWGDNSFGQLGDGSTTHRNMPVNVASLGAGVTSPSAGGSHTCAITANQVVACWGWNERGQIGDGTSGSAVVRTMPMYAWDMTGGDIVGLGARVGDGGRSVAMMATGNQTVRVPWERFQQEGGGVRPALGDVDGDGYDEVVLGLTDRSTANGWLVVLDDHLHNYALLQWIQVQWPAYNAAIGVTYPAVGDIDGDGKAEIVVGLGRTAGVMPDYESAGWFEIFDDASNGYAHLAWRRVNWWAYERGDGRTHPAVGDLDGDGVGEIIVGLGPGSNGWLEIFNGAAAGFSHRAWVQVQWIDWNAANGMTFPAAGDVDGDGKAEIVIGLGGFGYSADGWYEIVDDAWTGFAHVTWRQVPWPAYCEIGGETHPAVGQLDGDAPAEIVLGFNVGPDNESGWLLRVDDASTGFAPIGFVNAFGTGPRSARGTFPAVGRRR